MRYYAKTRILNDMIGTAKKRALYDREYLILVMDSSALKVFSSCCKMFEVFGAGLYHIERLEKKREGDSNGDAAASTSTSTPTQSFPFFSLEHELFLLLYY